LTIQVRTRTAAAVSDRRPSPDRCMIFSVNQVVFRLAIPASGQGAQ
jgi:hypothetical protein